MRDLIFKYIKDAFDTEPDYPFADDPEMAVLRNRKGKWYGIIMNITKRHLGLRPYDETIDIINVKCDPEVIKSLVSEDGFFPAYHMNKKHWLTILLDGTVDVEEIYSLISVSYDLVMQKNKKIKTKDEK